VTGELVLAVAALLGAAGVLAWSSRVGARRRLQRIHSAQSERRSGAVRRAFGGLVRYGRRPPTRGHAAAACCGVGGTCLLFIGPVGALIAAVYTGLIVRGLVRLHRVRDAGKERADGLDALSSLAADLRAGLPPVAAQAAVAQAAVAQTVIAQPVVARPVVAQASGDTSAVWPSGRLGELAGATFRLAEQTGAPLADLLDRVEADARTMDRAIAAAAAQAAGARATAFMLTGLPVGGIGLGYALGVDPLHVLLRTPIGAACAVGALALQVAGLAWADRLTDVAARRA
jgi:tight adherence protein B